MQYPLELSGWSALAMAENLDCHAENHDESLHSIQAASMSGWLMFYACLDDFFDPSCGNLIYELVNMVCLF